MTSHTAISLSEVLREAWTEESFKKAFDMEIQAGTLDLQKAMNRQTLTWTQPHVDMSPKSVHARKARQDQMMRQLAAKKRGNKPSYRQRQKNGRAGRK